MCLIAGESRAMPIASTSSQLLVIHHSPSWIFTVQVSFAVRKLVCYTRSRVWPMCRVKSLFPGLLSVKMILLLAAAHAATVDPCTEAALRSATREGGYIIFNCDGTIVLSNTIVITRSVVLDATGRNVTLSGNGSVRIFEVTPAVELTLLNLNIADGLAPTNAIAEGGAILVREGSL